MAVTTPSDVAQRGRAASRQLALLGRVEKDAALHAIADQLVHHQDAILAANAADLDDARLAGTTGALLDRLALDPDRIGQLAAAVRAIAALEDPCGTVVSGMRLANGLEVTKIRVPIGRILVVYEARPNVTVDVAALCLKASSVALLRGSASAARTNQALVIVMHDALRRVGITTDAVIPVGGDRDRLAALVADPDCADVVIPRGGESLKAFLTEHARIPMLAAAGGNCHVYVDQSADVAMAERIIVNAKTQRPGVCNAAETLLIHQDQTPRLGGILQRLADHGVELRGCERTRAAANGVDVHPADDDDYATEFLDLVLAVRVVDSLDDALDHIARFSTGHSEAIITESVAAAERFTREVDAACVYVNASTRFTDGGQFGMGAEIGNSTSRLHARGPIGLADITTTKYVVRGAGQVRG